MPHFVFLVCSAGPGAGACQLLLLGAGAVVWGWSLFCWGQCLAFFWGWCCFSAPSCDALSAAHGLGSEARFRALLLDAACCCTASARACSASVSRLWIAFCKSAVSTCSRLGPVETLLQALLTRCIASFASERLHLSGCTCLDVAPYDHFLPRLGMSLYNMFYQNQKGLFSLSM